MKTFRCILLCCLLLVSGLFCACSPGPQLPEDPNKGGTTTTNNEDLGRDTHRSNRTVNIVNE